MRVGSQISPRRAKKDSNIPYPGRTRSVKCPTPANKDNQIPTPCPAFFFIAHFWSLHASGLAYLSEQPHWAQLRFSPWILRVSETAWIHLPRLSLENGCHQVSVWLRSLQFFISRPWQPFSDRLPGIEVVVDGGGVDDFKFRPHGATVSNASCVVAFRRAACVVAPSSPRRNDFPGAKCNNGNPGGKAPFCVN